MEDRASRLWRIMRWPVLMLAAVLAYGTTGYMVLESFSFLDALYMTTIVLSTVGLREVRPLDSSGKALTISLIVLGVALALVSVSLIARWIVEVDWPARSRRRRMQRQLDRIADHVIVCAYGRVGRAVVRELQTQGMPMAVVDRDEALEADLVREGVPHVIADPSDEEVLRLVGVDRARALVTAVDSDATNVYITLTARTLNPGLFIVARASEEAAVERLRRAGADRVVSPYAASGRHMAALLLRPQAEDVLEVPAPGGLRIAGLEVEDDSDIAGRPVTDVAEGRVPLLVRRSDGTLVPNPEGSLRLRSGDTLLLLEQ